MADLQAAIADDDAVNHELQDRLLVVEGRRFEPPAGAFAERLQTGSDGLSLHALTAERIGLPLLAFEKQALVGEMASALRQLAQADRLGLVGVQQALVGPHDTIEPSAPLLAGGAVLHRASLRSGREAVELRHQPLRAGQQPGDVLPHGGLDLLGLDVPARASCRTGAEDAVLAMAHVVTPFRLTPSCDVSSAEHGQAAIGACHQAAKHIVMLGVVAE